MAWDNAVVTNNGVAMLQQVLAGEVLTLDWAAGGTGTVPPSSLMAQTALKEQKQNFAITGAANVPNGKKISVQITNVGLMAGYLLQQVGIWAHVGNSPPVLFAILQDNTGIAIPSDSEVPDFAMNFYAVIDFSNESNFNLIVDPSALVTLGELNEKLANLETKEGAQAKADAALNSAKQYTDQEVAEVSQALDAHKAAAAPHSGHETPAGAQAKANTAEANAKAYTDAHEQKAAPHSGHETPAGAQAKANAAEANAKGYTDTHAGTKNTHGVGSGYYIAKTRRSDQLLAWNDVQGKPSNFTPSAHKSTHASGGNDALTPSDIGAETPAGAQAKADAAAGAVQAQLDAHLSKDASKDNVHGLRSSTLALGDNSLASGTYSIAIGLNSNSGGAYGRGIAIGCNTSTGSYSIAIGYSATTSNSQSSIAIGNNAKTGAAEGAIAIGLNANSTKDGIALGINSTNNSSSSIALGELATVGNSYEGVLGVPSNVFGPREWIVPGNFTVSGTKNFEIPHPKPEKSATHRIRHGAVESPTPGDTLYRWKVQSTKDNDLVTIDLPDYFVWLNKDVQIFVTPQGHFGNGYGELNEETEQLEIHCQFAGEYNVLVIGTRNDDHQSVRDWYIKGVEREIGESWTGETYAFSVDEIIEIEEIKEVI